MARYKGTQMSPGVEGLCLGRPDSAAPPEGPAASGDGRAEGEWVLCGNGAGQPFCQKGQHAQRHGAT